MSEPTTEAARALLARIARVSDESEYDAAGFRRDLLAVEGEARAPLDKRVAELEAALARRVQRALDGAGPGEAIALDGIRQLHFRVLPADRDGIGIASAAFDVCAEDEQIWPCSTILLFGPAAAPLSSVRSDLSSVRPDMSSVRDGTPAAAPRETALDVELARAADEVRRHVTVGSWYDDPANDRGRAAVNRLHDAERALLDLYRVMGLPLGDQYATRAPAEPRE